MISARNIREFLSASWFDCSRQKMDASAGNYSKAAAKKPWQLIDAGSGGL
jgi:hypothetical protein